MSVFSEDYWTGYKNGESSALNDWYNALSEYADLPDDVEDDPEAVARYIGRLQSLLTQDNVDVPGIEAFKNVDVSITRI